MSYVEANLLPHERITYRARLHWIIFVRPTVFFLLALACFAVAGRRNEFSYLYGIGGVLSFVALLSAVSRWIARVTSEFAVTSKRVLIKIGFVRRHSVELLLEKVEGIGVDQGLLGRLFDYGTIVVTGTGGTRERFHRIAAPLQFRRQVQTRVGMPSESP